MTNIDIVIVNITIVGSSDKFWRLLWHPIIFALFFENATTDKTVQFHPVCLKCEPLLFLVCIDVAIGFNIAKNVF